MLKKEANVYAKTDDGYTPLHNVVQYGHAAVIRLLLAKGANVETKTNDGSTALHFSAASGHEGIVQLMLEMEAK
jgi:ankyrin repeat protein